MANDKPYWQDKHSLFCNINVAFLDGWPLIRGRNQYFHVQINTDQWPLLRDQLSSGWPLKRGSTVLHSLEMEPSMK